MKVWINGPAKRPEKTRDRSVIVEVEVNAAGNIRLNLLDTIDDPSRRATWITARLEVARELRAALDAAIREVEGRSGDSAVEERPQPAADDVIRRLWLAAGDLHAESLLEEMITRAGLEWRCACAWLNGEGDSVCGGCGVERAPRDDDSDSDSEEE